jgi:hypothetical protein
MSQPFKKDRLSHQNRMIRNSPHQDYSWKQLTNKYKNTCCVCNRSIDAGDVILWNKDQSLVCHLPEMCEFLGIRKKRKSTRADDTNPRAKGTNPRSKKQVEEERMAKRIAEFNFPVEVSKVNG